MAYKMYIVVDLEKCKIQQEWTNFSTIASKIIFNGSEGFWDFTFYGIQNRFYPWNQFSCSAAQIYTYACIKATSRRGLKKKKKQKFSTVRFSRSHNFPQRRNKETRSTCRFSQSRRAHFQQKSNRPFKTGPPVGRRAFRIRATRNRKTAPYGSVSHTILADNTNHS